MDYQRVSTTASISSIKGLPTKRTTKPIFVDRTCKECANYPCFKGIDRCRSDFAKSGCKEWQQMVRN